MSSSVFSCLKTFLEVCLSGGVGVREMVFNLVYYLAVQKKIAFAVLTFDSRRIFPQCLVAMIGGELTEIKENILEQM